mgnify:CR=1 FL=1
MLDKFSRWCYNKTIKEKEIYSPLLLNNKTLLFPLASEPNKIFVISLNQSTPIIYLTKSDLFFSSLENSFLTHFRKTYGRSIVHDILLSEKDNIVYIKLQSTYDDRKFELVAELIPNSSNLLVTENGIIKSAFFTYKNRPSKIEEKYVENSEFSLQDGELVLSPEFIKQHFENEMIIRNKEKYSEFTKFINNKIKSINKKIKEINNDKKKADEMLSFSDIADSIFTLQIDLKSRLESVEINGKFIKLDQSKTVLENCQNFYKKAKKAKLTIAHTEDNLLSAQNDLKNFESIMQDFESRDERGKDELLLMYKPNKKHEVKATIMNRPWKYNLNGTYIYFGRNASQNDYLSFVMKSDREYTWLHIKDKSGAHLIIASRKPTQNELLFACEFALICSHCKTGEIVYTKKKNVRKGHVLGEAILKNYQTIKLNSVREETLKAFQNIKRCD